MRVSAGFTVVQPTLNQRVQGSSPCAPTIGIKDLGPFSVTGVTPKHPLVLGDFDGAEALCFRTKANRTTNEQKSTEALIAARGQFSRKSEGVLEVADRGNSQAPPRFGRFRRRGSALLQNEGKSDHERTGIDRSADSRPRPILSEVKRGCLGEGAIQSDAIRRYGAVIFAGCCRWRQWGWVGEGFPVDVPVAVYSVYPQGEHVFSMLDAPPGAGPLQALLGDVAMTLSISPDPIGSPSAKAWR